MRIIGIETSCDETALALLEADGVLAKPRFRVVKEIVSSQVKIHRPFGGVVPNLAKREHLKNLPILFEKLGGEKLMKRTDAIAVTVGPGLEPALWAGITFAQELGEKYEKPVIGANHLEGHLYSFLLPGAQRGRSRQLRTLFPAVALIVSGGHTVLLLVENLKRWKRLGETRDDAVGEAFDKVARMLRLPYPGGPEIEKLARKGDARAIAFPRPMLHDKSYDFSFSGLKTAVLYYLRDYARANKADVAASFEEAAIDVLVRKTLRAAETNRAKAILLSGGVAANRHLRTALGGAAKKHGFGFLVAPMKYNTDNAVMIAAAGYLGMLRKKKLTLEARGGLVI